MSIRNLLLGNGERLTQHSPISSGGGPKKYPYSIDEVRAALLEPIQSIKTHLRTLSAAAKPRGEGVFQLTLHPAFLGRSYFPDELLRMSGLRDLGSKQITIRPRKVTKVRDEGKLLATAQLFVAGNEQALDRFSSLLDSLQTPQYLKKEFTEIESLGWLDATDRLKGDIPNNEDTRQFEMVLHAGANEDDIVQAFCRYAKAAGVSVDHERRVQIGGLTFLPAASNGHGIRKVADFSFLRAVRLMPELRVVQPGGTRQATGINVPNLPDDLPVFEGTRVAIFDGGLGTADLDKWATEFVMKGTEKTVGSLLQHGNEVTSTFLFGRVDSNNPSFSRPFLGVDHYRVLSLDSGKDPDLFDVLERIRSVLDSGNYEFANLSLGPRLPIGDDDVHVWTATLDQICARHGILATVAVGNDGEEDGDAGRIQPPADMVNALAVGAADCSGNLWNRAPYSCLGPGRSPGLVKPDGLAFGGSAKEPFCTFNPLLGEIVGVEGTSYASPLALRTATGVYASTNYPLSTIALKALMVHHADPGNGKREEVGWGRFQEDPNQLLDCSPESVTVIYQGQLAKGEYLRAPIPFPDIPLPGRLELKATLCIQAPTDPEHVINYTRAGLQVTFRPRFGIGDDGTQDFFGRSSQYKTERENRDDAHKWETCLHRKKRFDIDTVLSDPVFDIRYHARQTSRSVPPKSAPDVHYAMVVTIKVEGMPELYNLIRQRYQILQPVKLRVGIEIPAS